MTSCTSQHFYFVIKVKMTFSKVLLFQVFVLSVVAMEVFSQILVETQEEPAKLDENPGISTTTKSLTSKLFDPLATFRYECFTRHNTLRSLHGSPNLTRNEHLEQLAQEWAEALLNKRQLLRSENEQYGESGAYKYSPPSRRITGDEICNQWYAEIANYDFVHPGQSTNGGKITHFSQVVWANTKEVGIGMAEDGQGTLFAVAIYDPPGNYITQFAENVKPLQKIDVTKKD